MSKVIDHYILQEVIGSGQYGKVYKAQDTNSDSIVAVKVVKLDKFIEVPKLNELTFNEIQTLTKIENPNVIRFIEMMRTSNNVYLVYEFCKGGTLEELIEKKKNLSESESLMIFKQIVNAFKSLYPENILHRDLKPSNILLNDGVIKVADFGFCKTLESAVDLTKTMIGSPIFMAPEILTGSPYSAKADIWSLGVVLFNMLFGFCPFEDTTIARLINQIHQKVVNIPRNINNISRPVEEIIRKMLVIDPNRRITWEEIFMWTDTIETQQNGMFSGNFNQNVQMPLRQIENNNQFQNFNQNSNQNFNQNFSQNINKVQKTGNILMSLNENNNQSQFSVKQNNLIEEETQNKKMMRVALKERSKAIFIANTLLGLWTHPLNDKTTIVCVYLIKKLYSLLEAVKDLFSNLQLTNYISQDLSVVISFFSKIRTELQNDPRVSAELNSLNMSENIYFSTLINYLQELKNQTFNNSIEEKRRWLLICNDVADCLLIEELFEKEMVEGKKYEEQPYFQKMKQLDCQQLEDFLKFKESKLKNKENNTLYNPVPTLF